MSFILIDWQCAPVLPVSVAKKSSLSLSLRLASRANARPFLANAVAANEMSSEGGVTPKWPQRKDVKRNPAAGSVRRSGAAPDFLEIFS